jgi:hypothetical protein
MHLLCVLLPGCGLQLRLATLLPRRRSFQCLQQIQLFSCSFPLAANPTERTVKAADRQILHGALAAGVGASVTVVVAA